MYQGATVTKVQVNDWQVSYLTRECVVPEAAVVRARTWLDCWEHSFKSEDTWVQRACGVHSLLVKVDVGRIDPDTHNIGLFGVDDCPDGLGVAALCNTQLRTKLLSLKDQWPTTRLLVLGDQSDDQLWLGEPLGHDELDQYHGLLLVRGSAQDATPFADRSITPCAHRNLRCWGEYVQLWSPVSTSDQLPWKRGFVLKPRQGMSCRDVYIWFKGKHCGSSRRADIEAALKRNGTMYSQQFIEPMACPFLSNGSEWLMVYRMFFGFDMMARQYVYLGGFWLARKGNLRLHGASDAVVGPLL